MKTRALFMVCVLLAVNICAGAFAQEQTDQAEDVMKNTLEGKGVGQCDSGLENAGLTPEQYKVTHLGATETPFRNEYWDNHRPGIYVDVVSGKPLFSSTEKFDSGTGWPSFTAPIDGSAVSTAPDNSYGMNRTEVKSAGSGSHLGHLFADGPGPTGLRYCINSASLRFISAERLEEEGYGEYKYLFVSDKDTSKAKTLQVGTTPTELAMFGAGCFWGVEAKFSKIPGVLKTTVGYSGGVTKNPSYEDVCAGNTGHAETVLVEYDPAIISYTQLLEDFWQLHDPTQVNRQGPDVGVQYRSVIFFLTPEQEKIAKAFRERLNSSGVYSRPIVTEIVSAGPFYRAEEYHQRYLEKLGRNVCNDSPLQK